MVKIDDIAYLRYQVTDLDRIETFLRDFGLVRAHRDERRLYMRAAETGSYVYEATLGERPLFLGPAFRVPSLQALEEASRMPGAGPVETRDDPFGGHRVQLAGPDGYCFDLVHGVENLPALPVPPPRVYNNASIPPARPNTVCRSTNGPTPILRISHCALYIQDPAAAAAWATQSLGLLASDEVVTPEGEVLAVFMRCDKGATPTDHHTLALIKHDHVKIHHSSFWVDDFDSLHIGALWLGRQNYVHEHGIGRHGLGSQVFSYWRDPEGFLHERFTDGDVFDNQVPTGRHPPSADIFFQWSPDAKPSFFE